MSEIEDKKTRGSLVARVGSGLKSGFGFVGSSVGLVVAMMLSNVLVIRWLEPESAGLWQTLMLIQAYATFAQLGLFSGLNRELPYQIGRDNTDRARELVATAQSHALLCVLSSLGVSVVAFITLDLSPAWRLGVATVGLSTAGNLYVQFLSVTYRGTETFARLSAANGLLSILAFVSVPLVLWWGFEGLCLRIVVMSLGWVAILHVGRPMAVGLAWDWSAVRDLFIAGGPAFLLGYLLVLANGFDRVLLLEAGGVIAVGLYAPAMAVKGGLVALPRAINAYVSPRMSRTLGETSDPRTIWSITWKATVATTLVMLPLVAFGWWAMPYLIELLFPKYAEGIPAAQLLSLSGLFMGARAATSVLSSLKAWWELSALNGLTVLLYWAIPRHFTLNSPDGPLYGVAQGWVYASAAMLPVAMGLMFLATHRKTHQAS